MSLLDGKATEAYFLEEGIASVVVTLEEGDTVEVGVIGNDGVVGIPGLLGVENSDAARHSRHVEQSCFSGDHCGEGSGPYAGDDVVGPNELRRPPEFLWNLFACVLEREGLTDGERDEHDDQQAGIDAEAYGDDRPRG